MSSAGDRAERVSVGCALVDFLPDKPWILKEISGKPHKIHVGCSESETGLSRNLTVPFGARLFPSPLLSAALFRIQVGPLLLQQGGPVALFNIRIFTVLVDVDAAASECLEM